ncbi:calponin homology domain-containing protein DDB_G0272472-like [Brachyistius frenatus]|uniref:calponin homology domain-containing protein DDB_G0272472-like n=1 Tax=Brachyistius frenatus TaxID=100188 RepID=UPI0037E871E2
MQRYRHYGTSHSSPSAATPIEEIHAEPELEEEEEEVYTEEEEAPLIEEEVLSVFEEKGDVSEEEVPQTQEEVQPVVTEREAKTASPESKNGKRTATGGGDAGGGDAGGGDAGGGGGAKYSMFTWFVVLALLGVWSSVAVVYFDVVDYDSVIARAKEFHMNFSHVLQGKLTAYDTDGDGDFDVEDAKVLLDDRKLKGLGRDRLRKEDKKEVKKRGRSKEDETVDAPEQDVKLPEEETTREAADSNNTTRDRPVRGATLRSALREELRMIHQKMEVKRIARVALAEIRVFLAEQEEEREAAWALKVKTLEVAQEQLREEREREEERVEKERMEKEKERVEKERMEKERMERVEKERMEKERMEKERMEKERMEKERVEKERMEMERAEKEAKEKAEVERLAQERAEKERQETERLAKEKAARDERERLEGQRLAKEKMEREQQEKERLEREWAEKERIEKERIAKEKERLAKERITKEKERLERERLAKERERIAREKERQEKERLARERAEKERLERERLAKERERLARERAEKEKQEKERLAKERLARERIAKEKAEKERLERERLAKERERLAKEKMEKERLERERISKEKARLAQEKERLEKERAARERAEKETSARKEKERAAREKELAERQRLAREKAVREKMAAEKERGGTAGKAEVRKPNATLTKPPAVGEKTQRTFRREKKKCLKEATRPNVGDSPADKTVLKSKEPSEAVAETTDQRAAEHRDVGPTVATATEATESASGSQDVESEIQAAVPLPPPVEDDFVADDPRDSRRPDEEEVAPIDTKGALVEEPSEESEESRRHLTSSRFTQEAESVAAEKPSEAPAAEPEPQSETPKESPEAEDRPAEETLKAKKKKPKLLNKSDKTIKAEIDAAEKLRKKGKLEEALRAFEVLVQQHPQSPRARYGRAQVEDDLAEKMRSNDMLHRAINSYREAHSRMRGSLVTLEKLVQIFPEDVGLKNDLGVAHLLLGDNKGAKKVYEEVMAVAPGNGFAKVHYGFILKSENKIAESIPYLKEGLESGEPGTDDGRFYFHLGDALQRVGDESAYHWYELGHQRGHFASVWQRSLYNVAGLKARPWWTPKETGYTDLVKMLERNWKAIRDEALAVMDQNTRQFVPEEENLREKGEWGQYTLWQQGKKLGTSCQSVPKTCSLLERFPEATGCKRGQIKFSVMQPGTHVWPHTGPTNCRLRMHLGLVIPKQGCRIRCTDQTRTWDEGKVLIFDDSFEHEVWQDADSFRLIFIVDVWHPELTQSQRQTLSPI